MISVEEAVERIVRAFTRVGSETIGLSHAAGRVLAEGARAKAMQPPFPVSSMDGYAVRAADATKIPTTLRVIGAAPAGHPFSGQVGGGEAVRIFTGGVIPGGADAIVIQEDTEASGTNVIVKEVARAGRHIRVAGLDFKPGDVLAVTGKRLSARDLSLLAAGDVAEVTVRRKPRVALVATGDELSRPGEPRKPGGIVASTGYGLSALIEDWGAEPIDLGIFPDKVEEIARLPKLATDADLIVTLGGASVGEHDLIQRALGPQGFALDFWKIAMRPGKPLIFGRLGKIPLLGLPGNPVSSFVCALLFLRPAIAALLGSDAQPEILSVRTSRDLPANDQRQDYMRARLELRDGELWVEPFSVQDSSMQCTLAEADALIIRKPHAPAVRASERVEILRLSDD
jgi:molybdopterin molybdotransferase